MDGSATGYPSYVVASTVCTHSAYGLGIHSYFDQGQPIVEDKAVSIPDVTGVTATDKGPVFLNGSGQITSVIDPMGTTANSGDAGSLQPVAAYAGSGTCNLSPSVSRASPNDGHP